MGVQTMGSQGGGRPQSHFHTFARQGSIYSLTLNEVQNHLGEPLHSMNLDELLKNVLPSEGDQPFTIDLESSSSQIPSSSNIQRQGSVTLSRALSKKTVDEVWREIQQGQNMSANERGSAHERQRTLGEMTLENFLVKAGVVAEESEMNRNDPMRNAGSSADIVAGSQRYPSGLHWLHQYHLAPPLQQQQTQQSLISSYTPSLPVPQPLSVGLSNLLDIAYPETQIAMSSPMMGTLSDTQTPGRKRVAPGEIAEKTVERRQKRMIKNRESAARSRARKQAYTNELENKVSRLEEENERLRKQKELDRLLYNVAPPEPKFRLRRTTSAPL